MKTISVFLVIILFCLTTVSGSEYLAIMFNERFEPDSIILFSEESPCFNESAFSKAYFVFLMDEFLNMGIFTGPSSWNHVNRSLSFRITDAFIEKTEFSFSDYFQYGSQADSFVIDIKSHTKDFTALYALRQIHSSVITETYSAQYPAFLNDSDSTLFPCIYSYYQLRKNKQYYTALLVTQKLHSDRSDDPVLFRYYALSLMDNGMFSQAMDSISRFYAGRFKNDLYYSLMLNIFAISGKFDICEQFLIEGRNLFPESKMLLEDGANLYSVIDSSMFAEYIELMENSE